MLTHHVVRHKTHLLLYFFEYMNNQRGAKLFEPIASFSLSAVGHHSLMFMNIVATATATFPPKEFSSCNQNGAQLDQLLQFYFFFFKIRLRFFILEFFRDSFEDSQE